MKTILSTHSNSKLKRSQSDLPICDKENQPLNFKDKRQKENDRPITRKIGQQIRNRIQQLP